MSELLNIEMLSSKLHYVTFVTVLSVLFKSTAFTNFHSVILHHCNTLMHFERQF